MGVGNVDYNARKVTESNATAFVNSGECLEGLKKQTIEIQSHWSEFDKTLTVILKLVLLFADNWTSTSAEILKKALENPKINQKELALALNRKSQSSISASLNKAGYDELKKGIEYYKQGIKKQW